MNLTKETERYPGTEYHMMDSPPTTENENIEVQNQPESEYQYKDKRIKYIIAIILLGFVVFVIVDSFTTRYVKEGIDVFLNWIEDNPTPGVFAFIGVYFIATGSILTLGSGFIFGNVFGLGLGVVLATLAVFAGASAGAIVSFLLGRYLLRDWVVNNLTIKYSVFEAIDAAMLDKGLRIMVLLRLSPIIPFNVLNYITGTTAISLASYTWAMFGILPGTILLVFLGATASSLSDSGHSSNNSSVITASIVIGIVFAIMSIVAVSFYAKKELNNVIQRQKVEHDINNAETLLENNANDTIL